MKNALSCPIDQLYLGGYLACDIDVNDLNARQVTSDLRYIAAKRLKTCESSEFSSVSYKFKLQKDLVYQVTRSGNALPPSPKDWIPAFYDALDAAILYWGIENDEEEKDNLGNRACRSSVDGSPKSVLLEPNRVNPRGSIYADTRTH